MATAIRPEKPATAAAARRRLTSDQVWRQLESASFAVISYVTPRGEPRSSGVVYGTVSRRLYTAVAADSWKARHIGASKQVSVTVPVRRGGVLALVLLESRFVLHLVRQHHRLEETLNGEQPEPGLGGRQSAQAVCDVEEFVQPLAWVDGGRIL